MLRELILRLGVPWDEVHEQDFGLESAERVADFFNNGGLDFRAKGMNLAASYAAVVNGSVEIGAWAWLDDEDFDEDATFEVYSEDDFNAEEIEEICKRIKEIYENE